MTDDTRRRARPRTGSPSHAPVAFLVGLVVLGVSLLMLGVMAAEGDTTPIMSRFSESDNGTAFSGYLVPPYAPEPSVLEVSYEFPDAPGDAYLVHCADLQRLREGLPPLEPLVRHEGVQEGSFSRSMTDYLGFGRVYFPLPGDAAPAPRAPPGGSSGSASATSSSDTLDVASSCIGAFVAFRWAGSDTEAGRPAVDITVREVPLDSVPAALLFGLAGTGGLLALAGGLAWGRRRGAAPPAEDGAGTAETLYLLAQRSEAWLARTRRYVLISGPVGIFLWYPLLIPWAWRLGREGSEATWMPWTLAAATLLLLVGMTALWAREFLRLDRELTAWREQLAELRRREETLMAELSA